MQIPSIQELLRARPVSTLNEQERWQVYRECKRELEKHAMYADEYQRWVRYIADYLEI